MDKPECRFEGCMRPMKSRELCQSHYVQIIRGGELKPIKAKGLNTPCTFEGCGKQAVAHGLCQGHYAQQRRGITLQPIRARALGPCTFVGCKAPVRCKGLCAAHYDQSVRGRALTPYTARGPVVKIECAFEGCTRISSAYGLCMGHRDQQRRGVELAPLQPRRSATPCSVEGCKRRASSYTSGEPMCNMHHLRWQNNGDPNKLTRDDVRPRGMTAILDAVADRSRDECWTDWADLPCWEGLDGWGGKSTQGYPTLGTDKVMWLAMEADGRPRPAAPGNHGLHACDNPACWNPDHLRWGTRSDNANDMHQQRNYCQHCAHCNPPQ